MQLFNGKDLSGWTTHPEQPGTWEVKEGILIGSTRQSHLFSKRADFANFHLRAEVKLNSGGDSGIRFRTPFKLHRGKEAWQVIPFGGYEAEFTKFVSASAQTGSVWRVNLDGPPNTLFRSFDPSLPRADEWCSYEVIVDGNRFITKLDGKVIGDCTDPESKYSKGHFALQCFSAQTYVQFRKIEIKELSASPLVFKNSIGMEFVRVPKGKSWLGGGKDKLGDREVEIPADFYLGKYEVTQEEWEKVMGENPSHFSRTGAGKDAVKDITDADLKRFPVEYLSWEDCQLFLAKLNQREKETSWVYRLPKNSEWEYACRGGPMANKADSAFDFYFANPTNTLLPDLANYTPTGLKRSQKVGSFAPNALGIFDMHGNVAEWCHEPWAPSTRILHGGCWHDESVHCTAVFGGVMNASGKNHAYGLRVARVPATVP